MNRLQEILNALQTMKRIAIFTHVNPDGDALGSSFAIQAALKAAGKEATVFLEQEMPQRFSFLNAVYSVSGDPEDFDGALALDCGSVNRLGSLKAFFLQCKIRLVVDHHYADQPFGDLYFSNPESAACAELVYELVHGLCGRLPQAVLAPLYTGLSTDTGQFKYSNVTAKTMKIAAELLAEGLDHRPITRQLYDTVKLNKLRFMGALADAIQLFDNGKIAVLYCPDSFLESYGLSFEEVEELPNTVLSVEGVQVSVIIKNKDAERLKVSLRCKENIDMALLAALFGGGGHKCAAGFVTELSEEAITSKLVSVIKEQLEDFNLHARA